MDTTWRSLHQQACLPYRSAGRFAWHFARGKLGRDPVWEGHLATEIFQARTHVEAVLYENELPLRRLMNLKIGDTLVLDMKPDTLVKVRCGDQMLTEGRMGRVGDKVAIRIQKPLRRGRTSLAQFEQISSAGQEA